MDKTKNLLIRQFFNSLGLTNEESSIYLNLLKKGPLTILELSRQVSITRTQLYRLSENLTQRGFLEEVVEENHKLYQAVSPEKLELFIKEKEQKIKTTRQLFSQVQTNLLGLMSKEDPNTKVLFYRGREGIKQLVWNELRTKGEIVGYTNFLFETAVSQSFAHQIFEEMALRKIKFRDIYSDTYLESLKLAKKIPSYQISPENENIQSRYLPNEKLNINCQFDIYNDVICYYHWHEGEIFGIEIYNHKIAAMQKQIFELLWTQAETYPIKLQEIIQQKTK